MRDDVKKPRFQAAGLLLLGTFFWGVTFIVIKDAIARIDVFSFLAWRFLIAAAVLALIFPGIFKKINRRILWIGIWQGLVLAVSYVTQTMGLKYTTATRAAFITGLSVVLVPLLSPLIRKRVPSLLSLLAALLAVIGMGVMTWDSGLSFNRGDWWVLACAFSFALFILLVGKFSSLYDPIALAWVQILVTGIVSALCGLAGHTLSIPPHASVWRGILICAILATAFMYVVQNRFQHCLTDLTAAVIYAFEPLFAALAAWMVLGEPLTAAIALGGSLLIAAMVLAEIRPPGPLTP